MQRALSDRYLQILSGRYIPRYPGKWTWTDHCQKNCTIASRNHRSGKHQRNRHSIQSDPPNRIGKRALPHAAAPVFLSPPFFTIDQSPLTRKMKKSGNRNLSSDRPRLPEIPCFLHFFNILFFDF